MFARVAAVYWWAKMRAIVRQWVQSCRDCGTRKARPKEVIPPLRSLSLGFVGDRWALDVAGPLPVTGRGNRYVIAAVEYATRYAVAVAVPPHTALDIARFIMERVILVYGPLRELVMDGAPELNGKVMEALVTLLQASQTTPVPYRPALLGLVERFHRTWKDMVSMYVAEEQKDWDNWMPCALYAYNGARHTTTGYSPNELLMGRRLRAPNELLRASGVTQIGTWASYHRQLVKHMAKANEIAQQAAARDQDRRARFYNHRVRSNAKFEAGDLVWVLKPPRGKGVTKLAHQWMGPARVLGDAGFDNLGIIRLDDQEEMVAHCSFLTSYHGPDGHLQEIARRTIQEMDEDEAGCAPDVWRRELAGSEEGEDTRDTQAVTRPEGGMGSSTEATRRPEPPTAASQHEARRAGRGQRSEPAANAGGSRVTRRLIREHKDEVQDQQRPTEEAGGTTEGDQLGQESTTRAATVETGTASSDAAAGSSRNSGLAQRQEEPPARSGKRASMEAGGGSAQKKRRKRGDEAEKQREELSQSQQRGETARTARAERALRRSAREDGQEAASMTVADADTDQRVQDTPAPQQRLKEC